MTEIVSARRSRRFALRSAPQHSLELEWGTATDVGPRRSVNEDSLIAMPGVYAVADGLGGHSAGDVASAAAVARLAKLARSRARRGAILEPTDIDSALIAASREIAEVSINSDHGSGTTVSGMGVVARKGVPALEVFNVGDSRVYRLREGVLTQITVDHSFVQDLVDAGRIRPEDAEFHPDANVITRALGFGEAPPVDHWSVHPAAGTRFLACTDGLTRELSPGVIATLLGAGGTPQETSVALVSAAVKAGGRDNVTVVVVDVLEAPALEGLEESPSRSLADTGAL